jgi:hypothetical protein
MVAEPLLPFLRRARDHIDRHYSRALDLDQLAAVAGVSKFHFARCFEATYGETPIRYPHPPAHRAGPGPAARRQPHGDRSLHGGRVLQPRVVLITLHSAGWRVPHRLSRPLGGPGWAARPGLLPVHVGSARPGADDGARAGTGSRNLREAPARSSGLGSPHDHKCLTCHCLLPRPGRGARLLRRTSWALSPAPTSPWVKGSAGSR